MKEKIEKLQQHLQEHPADYQSKISLFKLNSEQIQWEIDQRKHEKRRKIAECKRKLDGEQEAK